MWTNTYKDYKPDDAWVKDQVEPTKGITGCEMHELNGWGNNVHIHKKKKEGVIRTFLNRIFRK